MAKPVLATRTRTASKLLQYAQNVFLKMSEHTSLFPNSANQLAQLELGIEAYQIGLTEASFRDMRQVELKNQQAERLRKMLYILSLYVETIAEGDPATILAAGFVPSKSTANTAIPSPKPTDFRVEISQAGQCAVHLRVKSWKPVKFYQFEYRVIGSDQDWTRILSNKSKIVISDLQHLKEHEFRVTYLGRIPEPNYSDIVRSYVI